MSVSNLRRLVLTTLFNQLYSTGGAIYDPLTTVFFGKAWHNWRRAVLPFVAPGPTLEIACGTGKLLPELADRSSHVVGYDRSPQMLQRARVKMRNSRGISCVLGDARSLPFEDQSFNSAVSTFPAGFIASPEALDEVARVLKPGGRFIVVVSARFTRFQWRRPYIHAVLRIAYGSGRSMNRWADDLLSHPNVPGEWQDIRTPEGEAFVWVATRSQAR
jgi:ubiquinone/menaquinone biosynthesis C-methylase UbiE